MKKPLSILYTLFSILFLVGCSSDDDLTISNNNDLVGVWKLTAITLTTPLDMNNDGVENLNVLDEFSIGGTMIFNDNTNGTIFYPSNLSFNTREENGQLIFMIASSIGEDHAPSPMTYSNMDNNVIVDRDITFDQINENPSALTLNQNTLSMEVINGFVVKDIITFEPSISQDVTYVFTRQ